MTDELGGSEAVEWIAERSMDAYNVRKLAPATIFFDIVDRDSRDERARRERQEAFRHYNCSNFKLGANTQ